ITRLDGGARHRRKRAAQKERRKNMTRLLRWAALVLLGLAPAGALADNFIVTESNGKISLYVIDGRAYLVAAVVPGEELWLLKTTGTTRITLGGDGKWRGLNLAYDPDGDTKAVYLSRFGLGA